MQREARKGDQGAALAHGRPRLVADPELQVAAFIIFGRRQLHRERQLAQRPVLGEVRVPVVKALVGGVVAGKLHVGFDAGDVHVEEQPVAFLRRGPEPVVDPTVLLLRAEEHDLRAPDLRARVAETEPALGQKRRVLRD